MMSRPVRQFFLAATLLSMGAAGGAVAQETNAMTNFSGTSSSQAWNAEAAGRTPLATTAPVRHLPFSVAPNWRSASERVPLGQMPAAGALDYAFHNAGGNG